MITNAEGQKIKLRGGEQITPTSGIQTNLNLREELALAKKSEYMSDGENVDLDEDEMQTKAFEARESQWNRKLSVKRSEEKQINQWKSNLSKQIVKAFEEARNYHYSKDHAEFQSLEKKKIESETQPQQVPGQIKMPLQTIKEKMSQ